jgi:hypothetical protein
MADGELTLKLDDETLLRLKTEADAAGLSVADYARDLVVGVLGEEDGAEDLRIAEECDRTGVSYTVDETAAYFHSELMAQVEKN